MTVQKNSKKRIIKIINQHHELYGSKFEVVEEHKFYFRVKLSRINGIIIVYKNECKEIKK